MLPGPVPKTFCSSQFGDAKNFYRNLMLISFAVGTTWDKDFRICLVLSSLKMDLVFDKNSEFYVPEEQVRKCYQDAFNAAQLDMPRCDDKKK